MSLRDQLVKAGLASKKDKRRVELRLKQARRQQQGRKQSKRGRREQERRQLRAQEGARLKERRALWAARRAEEEAQARRLRINQILEHHGLRCAPGPQRFWHRTVGGSLLGRLDLAGKLAAGLREGTLALAYADPPAGDAYVVVTREVAQRIASILPERIVHFNEEPPAADDPSDPVQILRNLRLIEVVLRAQLIQLLASGIGVTFSQLGLEAVDEVARRQLDDDEHHHGDHDQCRDHVQQSPYDEVQHRSRH